MDTTDKLMSIVIAAGSCAAVMDFGWAAPSRIATSQGTPPIHGGNAATVVVKPVTRPNLLLMQAMRKIERLQAKMPFTSGNRTEEFLQEARAGGMYDLE